MQKSPPDLRRWLLWALLGSMPAAGAHSPGEDARVFFRNLQDGDRVTSPVRVEFGIQGYGIVPADVRDRRRHTGGHHHLLVDYPGLPELDRPLPQDDPRCIHFDGGETWTLLPLSPGRHRLQLILGDEDHEPTDPPLVSEPVVIEVIP